VLDCIKREVRPCGRKDVQFLFFEKQFCCAAVPRSSIKVKEADFTRLASAKNSFVIGAFSCLSVIGNGGIKCLNI
jgi:hypothetical protein